MSRRLQFGASAAIALLVVGALIAKRTAQVRGGTRSSPAVSAKLVALGEAGSVVPEFSVTDINGRTISAEDMRGKILLVDYWATWCQPCEREMPGYQRLQEKYRDRGLLVIGIAFDGNMKMGNETVEHYARRLGIRYPLVLDHPDLQKHFGGIQGLPTTFLIDRTRTIRFKVIGFEYTEKVEAALAGLP